MSNNYSLPLDSHTTHNDTNAPTWQRNFNHTNNRHSTSSDVSTSSYRDRMFVSAEKLQRSTMTTYRRASDTYRSLSLLQRVLLVLAACFAVASLVLFLRFGESVFAWIAPLAEKWRGVRGGWLVLWLATFVVGVPPLIGYSSCVTVAGFVYGVWKGSVTTCFFPFPQSQHNKTDIQQTVGSSSPRPQSSAAPAPSSSPVTSSRASSPASSPTIAASPPSP